MVRRVIPLTMVRGLSRQALALVDQPIRKKFDVARLPNRLATGVTQSLDGLRIADQFSHLRSQLRTVLGPDESHIPALDDLLARPQPLRFCQYHRRAAGHRLQSHALAGRLHAGLQGNHDDTRTLVELAQTFIRKLRPVPGTSVMGDIGRQGLG
jgi:hypothetical protein